MQLKRRPLAGSPRLKMLQRRTISSLEAAVLRAAIDRAPHPPVPEGILASLDNLRVVSRCDCGCDSVDFAAPSPSEPATHVADGIGKTPPGGQVGVLVWARGPNISGYDLGAGDEDLRLPMPDSICPWQPDV